jgi:glycosyltransferase involved in cell wall biosynthesis
MPRVSVIIPIYNSEKYVQESIESVLHQTFKDFELIFIDDGSTDRTKEILSHYKDIVYFYQENSGPSRARNEGIRRSHGQLISFLDADDLWFPDKLELEVKYFDTHPDIGLVTCDALAFTGDKVIVPSMAKERPLHSGSVLYFLLRENFLNTNNVLIRRDVFDKVGMFDETRKFSEDYDLWLRIAQHYKIGFVRNILTKYRVHDLSRSQSNKEDVFRSHLELVEKYLGRDRFNCWQRNFILSFNYFKYGYNFFSEGQTLKARQYLGRSISLNPFQISAYVYLVLLFLPQGVIKALKYIKNLF